MRRLIPFLVAFVMFGGVMTTSSSAANRCTIRGSTKTDFLSGTDHHDFICGLGGNDFISGKDGSDRLRGGPNNDTIVGGRGADAVLGRGGNDKLFVVDGHPNDLVRGGPGNDQCYGEKGDRFRGCEQVRHSNSPSYPRALALALSRALDRSIAVAERKLCHQRDIGVCISI